MAAGPGGLEAGKVVRDRGDGRGSFKLGVGFRSVRMGSGGG